MRFRVPGYEPEVQLQCRVMYFVVFTTDCNQTDDQHAQLAWLKADLARVNRPE
jgi:hypothetical protein